MLNILEYVSDVSRLQHYISLNIKQIFDKRDIEFIARNCTQDVIDLFYRTYKCNSYMITVVLHLHNKYALTPKVLGYWISDDPDLTEFTYDELSSLMSIPIEPSLVSQCVIDYLIKMKYDKLIPDKVCTIDIKTIHYLEKIGRTIDYSSILDIYYDTELDPYIIRKCVET